LGWLALCPNQHILKNLFTISLFVFTSSACLVSAQDTSATRQKNSKATPEKTITKDVTFTRTEEDYSSLEIERFDAYVKKHKIAVPGANGDVVISFATEKDGRITNIKVVKGLNKAADAEAVRLIKSYGNWHPNTMEGKPEKSTLTLPISFGKKRK
jgi:TonB family protein